MNENLKADAHSPQISQLYEEFKVLKNYLDSNKKLTHLHSTPDHNQLSLNQIITPVLLATPQTKKAQKSKNQSTDKKNESGLGEISSSKKSQKESQYPHSNRQQLIDEYYKQYEYSIKKVLKYKEKSAKKQINQNHQENQRQHVQNYLAQNDARKKLDFEPNSQTKESKTNEPKVDFSPFQRMFEESLSCMITRFENSLQVSLKNYEQKLDNIAQSIQKFKTLVPQKNIPQSNTQNRARQESIDIEEFNELSSQKDNESVCSDTFQQQVQDI